MKKSSDSFDEFVNNITYTPIATGLPTRPNVSTFETGKDPNSRFNVSPDETAQHFLKAWDRAYKPIFKDSFDINNHPHKPPHLPNLATPKNDVQYNQYSKEPTITKIQKSINSKTSASKSNSPQKNKNDKFAKKSKSSNVGKNLKKVYSVSNISNVSYFNQRFMAFSLDAVILFGTTIALLVLTFSYFKYTSRENLFMVLEQPILSEKNLMPNLKNLLMSRFFHVMIIEIYLIIFAYHAFFLTLLKSTPGKLFFNLKLMSERHETINFPQTLLYSMFVIVGILLSPTMLFTRLRQTWYDKYFSVVFDKN